MASGPVIQHRRVVLQNMSSEGIRDAVNIYTDLPSLLISARLWPPVVLF